QLGEARGRWKSCNAGRREPSPPRGSVPVPVAGGPADAGVERVCGVERSVELRQHRLGLIEMSDIVLRRELDAAPRKMGNKAMLDGHPIRALLYRIVVVEDLAEEVAAGNAADDA